MSKDNMAAQGPLARRVGRLMSEQEAIDFAQGCLDLGMCPRCLNAGCNDDKNVDMFGVCATCGLDIHGLIAEHKNNLAMFNCAIQ